MSVTTPGFTDVTRSVYLEPHDEHIAEAMAILRRIVAEAAQRPQA